jgi:hypothetical protein
MVWAEAVAAPNKEMRWSCVLLVVADIDIHARDMHMNAWTIGRRRGRRTATTGQAEQQHWDGKQVKHAHPWTPTEGS